VPAQTLRASTTGTLRSASNLILSRDTATVEHADAPSLIYTQFVTLLAAHSFHRVRCLAEIPNGLARELSASSWLGGPAKAKICDIEAKNDVIVHVCKDCS
jgi:hypothetical protein